MRLRLPLYLVLAGLALAVIFYVLGQVQGRLDAEDRAWNAAARALVQSVHTRTTERLALLAQVDSVTVIAARYRRQATIALGQADSLGSLADALAKDSSWYAAYQVRTQEVQQARAALNAKSAEADTLASTLLDVRSALALAQADIDSLSDRLTESIDRKECRIAGLVNCPSRSTTFLVGAALGAVVSAAVR
jgi:copper oxidase (laccase) domain-containing protein